MFFKTGKFLQNVKAHIGLITIFRSKKTKCLVPTFRKRRRMEYSHDSQHIPAFIS